MKKILKYITFLAVTLLVTASCDYDDTNYDSLTTNLDPNATFYVQFTNAAQTAETGVTLTGDLVEIETTVAVTLMGAPQGQPITINLTLDPSSTMNSSMFTLSASSITIAAGKTSGSVDISTIAANMPTGEVLKLVLTLDAGANTTPNTKGAKLVYNFKRIEFCPLDNGSADLAGSWSVTEDINLGSTAVGAGWYAENGFSAVAIGSDLDVTGLGEAFIAGFWGEPVVAGGTFKMEVAGNGFVTIPRQYIYTTTWSGAEYDYEIQGSGTWTNCGSKPTLTFTYDIYYPGDAEGLALSYQSYLNGPALGGSFILN
ncbi:MAG: hypothetical protein COC16_05480 [Lutibacter sp.]|nr:MAG: hypothetical protein COC16_05480 [Lutibacter sp.]